MAVHRAVRTAVFVFAALGLLPAGSAGQVSQASERRVVDRAERLRQSGRTADARSELVDLLERAPASPEALALLFDISVETGQVEAFLPHAEAADAVTGAAAPRVRSLLVRGLIAAGLADSARDVARSWVDEVPSDETAILSLASAEVAAGSNADAIRALENASSRGAGSRAVHLRTADLLLEENRLDDAVDVWVALLSEEDPPIDEVADDLTAAADADEAMERLVDALDTPSPGSRAGSLLAVRRGAPAEARRLAAHVTGEVRAQFLREYVREADLADQPAEVAWAAGQLVFLSPRPVDKMRWRAMVADRSLVAGDTATARDAFAALAEEAEPGAGPHDAASRRLFELLAADTGRLDDAEDLLDRYSSEYPDSLIARAEMYAGLSDGLARAGDLEAAERTLEAGRLVIETADGPWALGPIDAAAGRLAFWAGVRDSAIARTGRSLAQPGLPAADRTARIQMLTALQAADSAEVELAGAAALGLHRDPAGFDVSSTLRELAGAAASPGRAAALAHLGALAAESGRVEIASGLWRRVVDAHPESAEAPAAILALARTSPRDDALRWLERLIVGYPESALAPVARRLLAELNEGGIGG